MAQQSSGWSRVAASSQLRASMVAWWLTGTCVAALPVFLIRDRFPDTSWAAFTGAAILWGILVSVALLFALPLQVDGEGKPVDHFGLPNGLSALRAYCVAPLLICAVAPLPNGIGFWWFVSLGFLAGFFDLLDGIAARLFGPITRLGKALDPVVDMAFFFAIAVGALALGVVPWWLAALIALRYLLPTLAAPIVFMSGRRPEIVHIEAGRVSTMTIGFALVCVFAGKIVGFDPGVVSLVASPFVLVTDAVYLRALWLKVMGKPKDGTVIT